MGLKLPEKIHFHLKRMEDLQAANALFGSQLEASQREVAKLKRRVAELEKRTSSAVHDAVRAFCGTEAGRKRMRAIVHSDKLPAELHAPAKAIRDANLGMNPSNDGNVLRLAFPPLTEERRKELVRVVKNMAEDGRIAVRNVRRSARHDLSELEKESEISADELERAEKELEKLTHRHVEEIDRLLDVKEHELLEI